MGSSFASPVPLGKQALAYTDWYIDPVKGKNSNFGNDLSCPIQTFGEYVNRCGFNRGLDHRLTFHLLGDIPDSDPVTASFHLSAGGYVEVIGENLQAVVQGTLASVVQGSLAANTACSFTDNGVTDFAPYDKLLFRMTSGPYAGVGCAWVVKPNGASCQTSYFARPVDPYNLTYFTPSQNQTYELVRPRRIGVLGLIVTGVGVSGKLFYTFIQTPAVVSGDVGNFYATSNPAGEQYMFCTFPWWAQILQAVNTNGCQFTGPLLLVLGSMNNYFPSYRTSFWSLGGVLNMGGVSTFRAPGNIFDGIGPSNASINQHSSSGGIELYDCASTFFNFRTGAILQFHGRVAGKNNTGPFVQVANGSRYIDSLSGYALETSTNGPGGYDFTIDGQSSVIATDPATGNRSGAAIPLSRANLLAAFPAGFEGGAVAPKTGTTISVGV